MTNILYTIIDENMITYYQIYFKNQSYLPRDQGL